MFRILLRPDLCYRSHSNLRRASNERLQTARPTGRIDVPRPSRPHRHENAWVRVVRVDSSFVQVSALAKTVPDTIGRSLEDLPDRRDLAICLHGDNHYLKNSNRRCIRRARFEEGEVFGRGRVHTPAGAREGLRPRRRVGDGVDGGEEKARLRLSTLNKTYKRGSHLLSGLADGRRLSRRFKLQASSLTTPFLLLAATTACCALTSRCTRSPQLPSWGSTRSSPQPCAKCSPTRT